MVLTNRKNNKAKITINRNLTRVTTKELGDLGPVEEMRFVFI
jgi:putative component of toxin-antitoxin plasmid stabilization module